MENLDLNKLKETSVSEKGTETEKSKEEQISDLESEITRLESDEAMDSMLKDLRLQTARNRLEDLLSSK